MEAPITAFNTEVYTLSSDPAISMPVPNAPSASGRGTEIPPIVSDLLRRRSSSLITGRLAYGCGQP